MPPLRRQQLRAFTGTTRACEWWGGEQATENTKAQAWKTGSAQPTTVSPRPRVRPRIRERELLASPWVEGEADAGVPTAKMPRCRVWQCTVGAPTEKPQSHRKLAVSGQPKPPLKKKKTLGKGGRGGRGNLVPFTKSTPTVETPVVLQRCS